MWGDALSKSGKRNAENAQRNAHSAMLIKERLVDAFRSGVELLADDPAQIDAITPDDIRHLARLILNGNAFTAILIQK